MVGGLDVAEAIRTGTLDSLKYSDHRPHIAQRGIKFSLPLDRHAELHGLLRTGRWRCETDSELNTPANPFIP